MHIIQLIIMYILGVVSGGVAIGIFADGKRQDELAEAFEKGKDYERMRISDGVDDIFKGL